MVLILVLLYCFNHAYGNDNVHFVHTSTLKSKLTATQRCTIESVARIYPTYDIIIHSNSFDRDELTNIASNVKLKKLNYVTLFQQISNTNLLEWFTLGKWKYGYRYHHLADAARLAILYQYGGTYFDLDVLAVHAVPRTIKRFVAYENENVLNNAVMRFEKGDLFVKLMIDEFVQTFNPRLFGHNGPQLVTRTMMQYKEDQCKDQNNAVIPPMELGVNSYYGIGWQSVHLFFKTKNEWDDPLQQYWDTIHLEECETSSCIYGVHLWHSQIKAQLPFLHSHFSGSLLFQLMGLVCPETHQLEMDKRSDEIKTYLYPRALEDCVDCKDMKRTSTNNAIKVSIIEPVSGHQYLNGKHIPVKLNVQIQETKQIDDTCEMCVTLYNNTSCFGLQSNSIVLNDVPVGHHLLWAELCRRTNENHDNREQSNCPSGYYSVSMETVVAFNVNFQNAWNAIKWED